MWRVLIVLLCLLSGAPMAVSNSTVDGAGIGSGINTQSISLSANQDLTFMWWINWRAAIGSGGFGIVFELALSSPSRYIDVGQNNSKIYLEGWNGTDSPVAEAPTGITNNKWWHYVLRKTGTSWTVHVSDEAGATYDLELGPSITLDLSAVTFNQLDLQGADDRVTALKGWTRYLSDAEVRIERDRYHVCSSSDLWINTELQVHTDLTDSSGNGRHWSATGTLATITGPTIGNGACPVDSPILPEAQIDHSTPCCGSQSGTTSTGPVEPQVTTAWYRRCTGGGDVPTAADVADDEDWGDEFPPKEPQSWLTLAGQAGSPTEATERWGRQALSDAGRFVAGRLEEVGRIERRSSDKDGHYPPARLRVVAHDDDGTFRARLGDPARRDLINREAKYELSSYAARKTGLDPMPLIQGRIVDVQPALDRTAIVEVQDIMGAQYGALDPEKSIGLPIGDEHPAKPESTKGKIYPIVLGDISDAGAIDSTGADAAVGMLPGYDCGDAFLPGETPDPDGREFNLSLAQVNDKAGVNIVGSGDIVVPTRVIVSPIIGGEIGPPSEHPTGFLNPDGNGAGGPADPHEHREVWMDVAGGADSYIAWLTTVPGFHPVTNPTIDPNVRFKIVSGTATNPAFPPRDVGTWEFFVDFASITDGDQWGVQSTSPPLNLSYTLGGASGTTRYIFAVSAITTLGESRPSTALVVADGPAILSPTDSIDLTWDPPAEHPEAVIAYRVIGRTTTGLTMYLAIVGLGESPIAEAYIDDGHDTEKAFNEATGALVSENVLAWIVCAIGEVEIAQVYGADAPEGAEPKRTLLDWDDGTIVGPDSSGWPHAERYRVVGGIRQSGFYARGLPLKHHRSGAVTFAWNGCGYKDGADAVIDQAFRMLLIVLNEFVEKDDGIGYRDGAFGPIELFADGTPKFLTSKFEEAQDLTATWLGGGSPAGLGYVGAIAITEPISLREFLRRFFVTFGGHLTTNHRGQLYPYLLNPNAAAGSGRLYRERMEIARLITHQYVQDERENRITYSYHYNADGKYFRNKNLVMEDAASIAAHGGDRIGVAETGLKECYYGNDETTMADRWQRHLDLYGYAPRYATWATNLKALPDANGDPARFAHRKEGLGLLGEDGTPGQLMHTTVEVNPYEVIQTARLYEPVLREEA
jgi:hypothetical protein